MIFILAKTDLFSVVYGKVIKIVPQTKTVILGNYKTFQRNLPGQNYRQNFVFYFLEF